MQFRVDLFRKNHQIDDPALGVIGFRYIDNSETHDAVRISWSGVPVGTRPYFPASGVRIYRTTNISGLFSPTTSGTLVAHVQSGSGVLGDNVFIDTGNQGLSAGVPSGTIDNLTMLHNCHLLTWSSVADATSYTLYRTVTSGFYPRNAVVFSGLNVTSYVDRGLLRSQGTPSNFKFLSDIASNTSRYLDL